MSDLSGLPKINSSDPASHIELAPQTGKTTTTLPLPALEPKEGHDLRSKKITTSKQLTLAMQATTVVSAILGFVFSPEFFLLTMGSVAQLGNAFLKNIEDTLSK